jgi:TrmH family RNA methyltransferase
LAQGAFLVEGPRAISQILEVSPSSIVEILAAHEAVIPETYSSIPIIRLPSRQFDSIAFSKTPQGFAALVNLPGEVYGGHIPREPGQRVLYLHELQDPGNVGTCVRTAAALGFDGIILSDACADVFSPKVIAASAGTVLSLWIRHTSDGMSALDELVKQGFSVVAADAGGVSECPCDYKSRPLVLALGNEGNGLPEAITCKADMILGIPIDTNRAESLNVGVAGALCMYLLRR